MHWPTVVGLLLAGALMADEKPPEDPSSLLKGKIDAVVAVLDNNELDPEAKASAIDTIITPVFDFSLMSYLTLGKQQWSKITAEQKTCFVDIFVERLKSSYRDKLVLYSGQKTVFKPAKRAGNKVQIPTELVSQDESVAIIYKLYLKKGDGWQIYDIEVQGVSLIRTYRSQFSEVLSQGTMEDLLIELQKPEASESAAPPAG